MPVLRCRLVRANAGFFFAIVRIAADSAAILPDHG